jgi:hypothetical protein
MAIVSLTTDYHRREAKPLGSRELQKLKRGTMVTREDRWRLKEAGIILQDTLDVLAVQKLTD